AAIGAWLGWTQLPFVLVGAGLLGLAALLMRRARGEEIAATDRLPLGALMALAAWPIWIVISR
ncbi:MAG TPA: prepilin peptidase, partial [Allosphingosinicella sp.]|nr:prepilin peptidase [Allosphingosinicella sp.]